jgi:N-acetylneuraminate lyase
MTGVSLSMTEFLVRARDAIPTFAGIKYTHNDLMEYQQCIQLADGRLDLLFGRDEMLLAGLAAGAEGAIGSTYNYASPVYQRMITAFRAGDLPMAHELQARAIKLVGVLRRYGEIPAAKAIMSMMGVDCGPPRPPLPRLSAEQLSALYRDLEGLADIFVRPLRSIGQ